MRIKHNILFRLLGLFIFSLFATISVSAQNGTLKGTVKDMNGLPIAGASVMLEPGKKGTTTNMAGEYTLQASPGSYTLIVSYVGTQTQRVNVTVTANGMTENNFDMALTGELTQVIVGSRSSTSRTRIQTPVPVDLIQISTVVNEVGQVELSQILNYIAPSFQSARQTIADGTDHVDPAQLRGLGTDQVLVLVNGKRRHQSALVNVNGTVNRGSVGTDMSAIPATAIERIEILRDGAAAQYGSDAIAGVINIVLKKRTGVLEAGVSYGQYITEYEKNYAWFKLNNKTDDPSVKARDGENFQASLGYGFNLGKGYLSLTGEYINRQPTNRAGTYTGRIYPLVSGNDRDDSIMQARGLNRNYFDLHIGNAKMTGGNLFYNFGYPINDKTELYVFGGYGKKDGTAAGFYRYPDGATSIYNGATIYRNNVFAIYPNGFLPQINSELTDFSAAVGLRTKFNQWNFDISNTYGVNKFDFIVDQSVNYTQFFLPGNSQTVFDAGGLKFSQNTINADISRKYNVMDGLNVAAGLEFRIDAFGIRSGEPASYLNYDTASKAAAGAQVFAGFKPSGDTKNRNAKAVYTDLELDITKKFLVTGALRFENYSDFGSTLNYKFSTRYRISDQFNIRASTSSGFRAPSMQQRFYEKTSTLFVSTPSGLVATESGTFTNDSKAAEILGIPKLQEETSHSYSIGVAARPFTGFEITIDAYQINIKNRIVLTNNFTGGNNPQLQAQLSAAGASTANFFSNAIDTKAQGLETVLSYNTRFGGKHSLKFVLAAIFTDNEVKKGADGKPIIHASPILISSGQLGNYFNREDQSRIEVASPKNKISLTINYKVNKFGAMLRLVNFGKVVYLDPSINPDNPAVFPMNAFNGNVRETLDQEFSSKLVTDLSLSYQIKKELGITIGVNNLFDVYQDRHTHSGNMSFGRFVYSRRVQQHGFNGAFYFARLKLELPTGK